MKRYRHYKGTFYTWVGTTYHTETSEKLALYKNEKGTIFARPFDMFFGKVEVNGVVVDRFKLVKT